MIYKSRFAPSPSGLLHIGNARSAVLNWAYIKNKGGHFILRIDDTDSERSSKEFENKIKKDLSWLGIEWSKTFNQSERKNKYEEKILELQKSNIIYPCFETEEELALKKKTLLSSGKPPIYDRSALNLTNNEIKSLIKSGKKPHWRFKIKDEIIKWNDLIKGNISFDSKKISDPILIRENESLLYHLPSVIDDIEECITDIIRGEDHISNTAFHIQLFKSLKASIPRFGHHPFLTDNRGQGFAKRLGSLSIEKLIAEGFENKTLINYLIKIGTSKDLTVEKNTNKLAKEFDINTVTSSSPKFSKDVLTLLNKELLQKYDYEDVKEKYRLSNFNNVSEKFWNFIKYNITFFSDSFEWIEIINSDKIYQTNSDDYLHLAAKLLPDEPYNEKSWDIWIDLIKKRTGKKGRDLYMPIRIALTGKETGPELKYLLPLLTKNHILKKLGYIE